MRDLAALTAEDFEPLVGTDFEVTNSDVPESAAETPALTIRLVEVLRHNERPGYRQPFVLHFTGPTSLVLAQRIHHLTNSQMGELDLFLGPVMSDAPGITYEAIFA